MASAPTYEQIAWTSLGSAAATITFSSIAASWTDLRLIVNGSVSTTGYVYIRLNGDTAANYSYRYSGGNGLNTFSSSSQSNSVIVTAGSIINLSTTIPALITTDIFQYANTGTYKTSLSTSANDLNGTGESSNTVGLWRSTAAVTSITIYNSAGNFNTGTTAALYGIKAA